MTPILSAVKTLILFHCINPMPFPILGSGGHIGGYGFIEGGDVGACSELIPDRDCKLRKAKSEVARLEKEVLHEKKCRDAGNFLTKEVRKETKLPGFDEL